MCKLGSQKLLNCFNNLGNVKIVPRVGGVSVFSQVNLGKVEVDIKDMGSYNIITFRGMF